MNDSKLSLEKLNSWFTVRNLSLIILMIVLGLMTFQLFAPFMNIIVISFILVELSFPLYNYLNKLTKSAAAASIISTLTSFLLVAVPIVVIILITVGEAVNFTQQAQSFVIENSLFQKFPSELAQNANNILKSLGVPEDYQLEPVDLNATFTDIGGRLANTAGTAASSILTGGFELLFQVFLLIVSMIYIYQLREGMEDRIKSVSPFDDGLDEMFYRKFLTTTRAVVKGTVLVALAQATAVSIVMVLMNVGAPVLLWIIMVLASIIPIGSGLVWFPVGVVMILTGRPIEGIFLIVYSAIIINVIDTTLRPYVMKGATQMHPLITLFSILGGISAFGMIGILYGPLITVFFVSVLHVYRAKVANLEKETNNYDAQTMDV